jgi:nicotinate dehydrogenase subunit B
VKTSGTKLASLLAVTGAIALAACAPTIPAAVPPSAEAFPKPRVEQGAALAKLGDCAVCHTAEGGEPYAGGRPIPTPFGTIYASNITPDAETGIGRYSPAAFRRALHEGLRRDGAQLYPAFPYDHFSYATADDADALYGFLMTRRPVRAQTPPNKLIPPLGFRPVVAGWKALFFRPRPFTPTAGQSAEWNRGAYLVEGLGHCGACHSPRNWLGAEVKSRALDGGEAEGWYAPPLNASTPAVTPWTQERLYAYLRTGLDAGHAAAAGPMGAVSRELAAAPDSDVRAIAVYLASQMRTPAGRVPNDHAQQAAAEHPIGAQLFAGACATCHEAGAAMMQEGRPPLQLGTPLHEDDPRDTLQIVLQGLQPPVGRSGPFMPAFRDSFTDAQMAELAAYLRRRYSDRPAWRNLPAAVVAARKEAAS